MSTSTSQAQAKTYDFTRRKRWADLLLTELVDNIILVLSITGKILYCGHAVTELLGWRDVDLLDVDFLNLVDVTDQPRFRVAFNESLQTHTEFDILVRLRHSEFPSSFGHTLEPKYVLFDMKCYPHVTMDDAIETRCFFATASPYPSRNTAMLDTVLDLKAENNRLQQMITDHRARLARDGAAKKQASLIEGPIYATSSLHSTGMTQRGGDPSGACFPSSSGRTYDGSGISPSIEFANLVYGSEPHHAEELVEEGTKKKKLKRTHNSLEQYVCVTCGRTDSPEWRKGPAGPKTLCNACGLRWAKQMRKADEPTESAGNDKAL